MVKHEVWILILLEKAGIPCFIPCFMCKHLVYDYSIAVVNCTHSCNAYLAVPCRLPNPCIKTKSLFELAITNFPCDKWFLLYDNAIQGAFLEASCSKLNKCTRHLWRERPKKNSPFRHHSCEGVCQWELFGFIKPMIQLTKIPGKITGGKVHDHERNTEIGLLWLFSYKSLTGSSSFSST